MRGLFPASGPPKVDELEGGVTGSSKRWMEPDDVAGAYVIMTASMRLLTHTPKMMK